MILLKLGPERSFLKQVRYLDVSLRIKFSIPMKLLATGYQGKRLQEIRKWTAIIRVQKAQAPPAGRVLIMSEGKDPCLTMTRQCKSRLNYLEVSAGNEFDLPPVRGREQLHMRWRSACRLAYSGAASHPVTSHTT